MIINYTKKYEDAITPTKGSKYAAGHDLFAYIKEGSKVIPAGETVKIGTGIQMEIPEGTFGGIFARSGLANNSHLRPANCVGVVDSDYRGEIFITIHNDGKKAQTICHGDRIAQLVILPYIVSELLLIDELSSTERGEGGFGSTGV